MTSPLVDAVHWQEIGRAGAPAGPAFPRAVFLVAPDGLGIDASSASDNAYMSPASAVQRQRAVLQHAALLRALGEELPAFMFPGIEGQPDGVFPNNVFATARRSDGPAFLIGSMRHEVRRREAQRRDIPGWFTDVLGYRRIDLRDGPGVCELTGTLVIDRARALGVAGIGPRCDLAGAGAMSRAFGLSACLAWPMAEGEYHANVVLAILGGRTVVVCPDGWMDADGLIDTLGLVYGRSAVIVLDRSERLGFAGNCIALAHDTVWMSERAADSLGEASRLGLERNGFRIRSVPLDEVEKAGGSLRCCVAEVF